MPSSAKILINDFPTYVTSSTVLSFADDTQYFKQLNSRCDCFALQEDLDSLAKWSSDWNMYFNSLRCVYMRLGSCFCNAICEVKNESVYAVQNSVHVGSRKYYVI